MTIEVERKYEAEIADLKKANELLHKLMFNRGEEIERLREELARARGLLTLVLHTEAGGPSHDPR